MTEDGVDSGDKTGHLDPGFECSPDDLDLSLHAWKRIFSLRNKE